MEVYKYNHIYDILKENFNFDEKQYGIYIRDVLNLLKESEKKGETFIDIDNVNKEFEFEGNEWPEKHITALDNSGLIYSEDSPIIFENRKLSFEKWSKKIKKILDILLKKTNQNNINSRLKNAVCLYLVARSASPVCRCISAVNSERVPLHFHRYAVAAATLSPKKLS